MYMPYEYGFATIDLNYKYIWNHKHIYEEYMWNNNVNFLNCYQTLNPDFRKQMSMNFKHAIVLTYSQLKV